MNINFLPNFYVLIIALQPFIEAAKQFMSISLSLKNSLSNLYKHINKTKHLKI
ncbi:hypothetical protein ACVWYN_001698 [Pedobacter sp. UYP24]